MALKFYRVFISPAINLPKQFLEISKIEQTWDSWLCLHQCSLTQVIKHRYALERELKLNIFKNESFVFCTVGTYKQHLHLVSSRVQQLLPSDYLYQFQTGRLVTKDPSAGTSSKAGYRLSVPVVFKKVLYRDFLFDDHIEIWKPLDVTSF